MKRLLTTFFLLLILPSLSFAANFSGTWKMNGNGYQMVIKLNQAADGTITGEVLNSPNDTLAGKATGRAIWFVRTNNYLNTNPGAHPQRYEGALFVKGQKTMGGRFKHRNSWTHGWYATQ